MLDKPARRVVQREDFGYQVLAPNQSNHNHHPKNKSSEISSLQKFALISIIIIILLSAFTAWHFAHSIPNPVLARAASSMASPIYYPKTLAPNYHLDESSIKASSGILSFSFRNSNNGQPITVTEQAAPQNFDPKTIFGNSKNIPSTAIAVGTLYDIGDSKQKRYMIYADNSTLIFVNASTKIDSSAIQSMVLSFNKLK